ncbi:MAG: VWA domain-containing protein [Phycisphaerales bacterium JB060]
MRQFAFDNPWWLLVAIATVPLGVMALAAFRTMTPTRRGTAIVARGLLFLLLGLALAGVSGVRQNDRMAVVVAADVSGSVLRYGQAGDGGESPVLAMRGFIERAGRARERQDVLGVLAFAERPTPVLSPTAGPVADRVLPEGGEAGTDIASALNAAAAMIPPGAAGRVVLISDGNATAGDAVSTADQLARARSLGEGSRGGLPIDVVPIEYLVEREVLIEFVDAPPRAAQGSIAPVRVGLRATAPAAGILRLLMNGRDTGQSRRVLLDAGRHVEVFQVPLAQGRIHRFEAVFEPEERQGLTADTTLANNSGRAFTISPGEGAVLIVQGQAGGQAGTLAETLAGLGLSIERRAPAGVPNDLVDFEAYDLVILEGVGADEISSSAQEMLATFVTELGGGLIMVGGQRSFGSGGWIGSPVEALLPVHLDLPQQVQTPEVAIAIVLDNSGSMRRGVLGSARSQQRIANEAAALAVRNLQDTDQVSVISFNNSTNLVVPIGPNTDPDRTAAKIRAIPSGGGTRVGPAMTLAAEQVGSVEAKSRHIIVLTDGLSTDAQVLPGLAARIHQQGITISTIAVGDAADTQTMQGVAEAANGTFYNVINPSVLPQVFLSEVQVTRSPLVREGEVTPVVLPAPSPATVGLDQPPVLSGVNLTRRKDDPTITLAMATRSGEPLLAHWNAGLGKVAAFTSDADRWASRWVSWGGYERFWGQLVRAMGRSTEDAGLTMRVRQDSGWIILGVEAYDDSGAPIDGVSAVGTVYDPQGRAKDVVFAQVGPGAYEATADADEPGSYVVIVRPRRDGRAMPPMLAGVPISEGQEYRNLSSDVSTLRAIAEATGGRVLSLIDAERVFDRGDVPPSESRSPLWRLALGWALAVLVLDIGTRRVAWDRLLSGAFGADWLRARAALTKQGLRAGRSVESLRTQASAKADERVHRAQGAGVDVSATQADAQRSAHQAQQRILRARAERMAGPSQASSDGGATGAAAKPVEPSDASEEAERGLLAAKRRARQRFEDDGQS